MSGVLQAGWMYHSMSYEAGGYSVWIRAGLLLTAVFWILVWNVLVPNRRIWLISMLGRYTMPVFLLHGFLIKWMEKSAFFHWSENVNLLIAAVLSAGICICLGNPWATGLTEMKWRRRLMRRAV